MGQLDEATRRFISKVAEDAEHKPQAKDAFLFAKKMIRLEQNPKQALIKSLIGAGAKALTKEGSTGPLRIYDMLNDHYQKLWWDWEPETIWKTVSEDHGIEADRAVRDMIMALQLIVTSNMVFEDMHVFEKVTCALNQNHVDFNVIQPCEVDEIAFTVDVLLHIRGEKTHFEDEVLGYIAACAKTSGIVYLPPELYPPGAQRFLDAMHNDLELAEKVRLKKDDGSPAYQIQVIQLKEVAEYVSGQKRD
jgi:hypothetical protein